MHLALHLLRLVRALAKDRTRLALENLALRQQLIVLQRSVERPKLIVNHLSNKVRIQILQSIYRGENRFNDLSRATGQEGGQLKKRVSADFSADPDATNEAN